MADTTSSELDRSNASSRSLSRTSTWADDAVTIATAGDRKGSLPRSDTLVTEAGLNITSDKQHVEAVENRTIEIIPPTPSTKEGRSWYHPISLFWLCVDNWFLIGIAVFITLAYEFPQVGKEGGCE